MDTSSVRVRPKMTRKADDRPALAFLSVADHRMPNNTLIDDSHALYSLDPLTPVLQPLPSSSANLNRPAVARFGWLAAELLRSLRTARTDANERVVIVRQAQELIEEIGAELRAIESADPTWWGWASIPKPPGSPYPLK